VQRWNANRKLGQAVAFDAMDTAMKLADEYGVGAVAVDNAFHYLWGGGYVIDAAKKGYISYTCCTAALAEVVPFGGKFPTLGTNPHSWGFPTQGIIGYPICIDWATSTVAMGRAQQFAREGKQLPPGCAVDAEGKETTDPNKVKALMPFGQHKGYGLSLIDELYAGYIGGSLPTLRNRWAQIPSSEKGTCCFFFQCMRPDAISGGNFARGRDQNANVQAVLADILGHGNDKCMLPGQIEAAGAALSTKHGGLVFTQAEVDALGHIAAEAGFKFNADSLKRIEL
jgi:LDH2 family malate/lactate/ureidoglycolate dehydrogenase